MKNIEKKGFIFVKMSFLNPKKRIPGKKEGKKETEEETETETETESEEK